MHPRLSAVAIGAVVAGSVAACSPALDWREVHPDGSAGLGALFPCKPTSHARMLSLAGAETRTTLVACSSGGATWAVAFADVAQSFDLEADNGWTVQAKAKANSYEMDRNGYAVLDYAVEFYKPGEAKPFQAMTARRQIEPGRTDDGQFYLSLAEAGSGAVAELMELQKKLENPEALHPAGPPKPSVLPSSDAPT